MFFLLISRRAEAASERGFFNFWLWMAGSEEGAGSFRYRIRVEGAREQITYSASPVSLEVALDTVREEQMSLLLSDAAVRRLLR